MSLENATTYYWKAVAQDSYGAITPSDVWSFTTEASANGLCPAFALGLGDENFSLLRRLRDEILAVDEQGIVYSDTYYRHGWELFLILLTSPELRREAREIVEEALPVSQSLLRDREVPYVTGAFREGDNIFRKGFMVRSSALEDSAQ